MDLVIPAIEILEAVLGRTPRLVAVDAGFYSAKNEAAANAKGVKRVSIPNRASKGGSGPQRPVRNPSYDLNNLSRLPSRRGNRTFRKAHLSWFTTLSQWRLQRAYFWGNCCEALDFLLNRPKATNLERNALRTPWLTPAQR